MTAATAPALDASSQAELDRLAALPWRVYEAERAAAARALNMPLRDLDRLVYRLRGAPKAETSTQRQEELCADH